MREGCQLVASQPLSYSREALFRIYNCSLNTISLYDTPLLQHTAYSGDFSTSLMSIKRRVLMVVPTPEIKHPLFIRCLTYAKKLSRKCSHIKIKSLDDIADFIVEKYGSVKRKNYLAAVNSLRINPELTRYDSNVTAFVKLEMLPLTPNKSLKARIIQARQPKNVSVTDPPRWLVYNMIFKNLEHYVYNSKRLFNELDDTQEIAKCLNPTQRAYILTKKIDSIPDPYAIPWDGSAFDAHVNSDLCGIERKFYYHYLKLSGNTHHANQFMRYFQWQIDNNVSMTTSDGGRIKYKVKGNRMSGDWNTSIGNIILMCLMTVSILDYLGIPKSSWRLLDDGDDCMLIVSKPYVSMLCKQLSDLFLVFGQEVVVEKPINCTHNFEKINFCQSRPVRVDDYFVMA